MISLAGLVSQKAFGKFEMGKVISNPFANAFIKEGEGEDHEVSMANNSIDIIIKMATELKAKMGEDEKQIPAWIQDHIAKAENLISQASGNYHEYGDSNESVNETVSDKKVDAKVIANKMRKNQSTKAFANKVEKMGKVSHKDLEKILPDYVSGGLITNLFKESVNEAPAKLKHTISKKEWSKIPKYNKHIGMDGVHYIMKYDDKIGTYLQGVQIVDESVNEAPNTGEKIQNLNNRIKALKDKMAATKSSEQKNLIQQRLKNALQTLSNYKKQNISKESVSEGVSSADMDKIKGAVEAAKSFMNVGAELKKLGMKYTFATEPLAIYIIQPTPNNKVAIVNKKYVSKPDFVVGDIAVGVMEGNSIKEDKGPCWKGYKQVGMKDKGGRQVPNCVPNESVVNEEIKEKDWKTIYNVFVKFLKANTKALEIRVMMRDEAATKKAIESIISGLTNAQRSLKLESVNEASGRVPQIFLKTGAVEKKIKELMADRKKAVVPYNSEKDPTKKESLKQILIKLTKQIQGYEKNLIQLRDKEEEYIQQMNADAQLDVSAID